MDYTYRSIEFIEPKDGDRECSPGPLAAYRNCKYCNTKLLKGEDEYPSGGGVEMEEFVYSLCPKCGWWDLNDGYIYGENEDPWWNYYQANLKQLPVSDALSKFLIADFYRDLDKVQQINPYDFEVFIRDLMNAVTDCSLELTAKSRDGGIDLYGFDTNDGPVAVEVKRYHPNRPISVGIVRSFVGALAALDDVYHGYLVSSSYFTKDAKEYALTLAQRDKYFLKLKDIKSIRSWLDIAYHPEFDIQHIKTAINETAGLSWGGHRELRGFPKPIDVQYNDLDEPT
ncbi:MAG: restriction endonuclease [Desulfobacula sp.]|nr:restriction endonuclease [Desulfobacula sp.]